MLDIRNTARIGVEGVKNPDRIRPYLSNGPPIFYYKQLTTLPQTVVGSEDFSTVQNYCLFVGHGRSGHSLVGSLLNAHPEMVISHELDALGYLRTSLSLSRDHLFTLIRTRDRNFTQSGRDWAKFNYSIEAAEYQGKYETLRVIGDKKGGKTSWRLNRNPELFEELQALVAVPVRTINVVRNPYDNISSMNKRWGMNIDKAIRRYFRKAETVRTVSEQLGEDEFHRLTYEDLIADTRQQLTELCRFLGVEPTEEYLSVCSEFVFDSPSNTRTDVDWTDDQIQRVREQMADYGWLQAYSYE